MFQWVYDLTNNSELSQTVFMVKRDERWEERPHRMDDGSY
jgi:hypothetical protein